MNKLFFDPVLSVLWSVNRDENPTIYCDHQQTSPDRLRELCALGHVQFTLGIVDNLVDNLGTIPSRPIPRRCSHSIQKQTTAKPTTNPQSTK